MEQGGDSEQPAALHELWLGYDGLIVAFAEISAVLVYQPAWDRRIAAAFGGVPPDIRAVVLLQDGRVLPARRALADLQARWATWQQHTDTTPE